MRRPFVVATLIMLAGTASSQIVEGVRTNAEVNNQQRCVLRRL